MAWLLACSGAPEAVSVPLPVAADRATTCGTITEGGVTFSLPAPIADGSPADNVYDTCTASGDVPDVASRLVTRVVDADGEVVKIPVRSELDIDDYRQRQPSALPGAFLAWTKPAGDTNLTAFAMPWTNPRPGVVIASIDLEYGKDRVGVPTLLAVSAVK
jgi:hypothetical protein